MTASQVADQQILRGAPGTLSWQYLDADGEPADPGTVTVGVTRADGTVLVAAGQTTVGSGEDPRTFTLTPAQTAQLDLLAVTWTRAADSTTFPTVVEIVGGYYFTLAQARASDPALADDTKFPNVDLIRCRREIEDEFERICEVAFVPRYRRHLIDGVGGDRLLLPVGRPRRVVAIGDRASDGSSTAWTADQIEAIGVDGHGVIVSPARSFPSGSLSVVVAWEHGYDRPPPDVRQAALLRLRHRLTRPRTAVPDRAQTFQVEGGTVYRLDSASRTHTGIPDVDAVLDRWSMAIPGLA